MRTLALRCLEVVNKDSCWRFAESLLNLNAWFEIRNVGKTVAFEYTRGWSVLFLTFFGQGFEHLLGDFCELILYKSVYELTSLLFLFFQLSQFKNALALHDLFTSFSQHLIIFFYDGVLESAECILFIGLLFGSKFGDLLFCRHGHSSDWVALLRFLRHLRRLSLFPIKYIVCILTKSSQVVLS